MISCKCLFEYTMDAFMHDYCFVFVCSDQMFDVLKMVMNQNMLTNSVIVNVHDHHQEE